MKLPYSWLNDYTKITDAPRGYSHKMTMSGSKVEGWSTPLVTGVICAKITDVRPHTGSDHLRICDIDTGGETVQVVSGAPNLTAGDLVALAVDGAKLPGGDIKAAIMRGEPSQGMLCSFQELGLSQGDCPWAADDGILVFPPERGVKPGDDLVKALGLDETVIEFEITPNRPDCLSVIGIARESAATYGAPLHIPSPAVKSTHGDISDYLSVEIAAPDLCMRYTAAMVTDIVIAPSPQWMRDRLRNAGVRPINNIVDITNYVMLEYGQPMHAFDYSCIADKKIIVRGSVRGETIVTLDGQTRELSDNTLLITDPRKAVGIAGVMGGENSEITGSTSMIVLESACFSGPSVRGSSRRIGMRTEASGRFEKGLDSENTLPALLRSLELVELLGAGKVVGGVIDVYPSKKTPRVIKLETGRICRFIGAEIERADMVTWLTALGFTVDGDDITVPSWRDDVEGFADIAEEVARFYGYDNIEPTLFLSRAVTGGLTDIQNFHNTLADACIANGYYETRSISFISPRTLDRIELPQSSPIRHAIKLINPLGEDQSLMRTTLLPSMLEVIARNYNHRCVQAKLYEMAVVYRPMMNDGAVDTTVLPDERLTLIMGSYGDGGYASLKGAVENLLDASGIPGYRFEPNRNPVSYHPGRTADIVCGGKIVGVIGQVHPDVLENFGIGAAACVAQLSVDALYACRDTRRLYSPVPRYPAVTRDLAIICDENVYVQQLEDCIRDSAGTALESVELFDVYQGAQVGQNKKSVAFAFSFRSADHTLTDSETDVIMDSILGGLSRDFSAVLRA